CPRQNASLCGRYRSRNFRTRFGWHHHQRLGGRDRSLNAAQTHRNTFGSPRASPGCVQPIIDSSAKQRIRLSLNSELRYTCDRDLADISPGQPEENVALLWYQWGKGGFRNGGPRPTLHEIRLNNAGGSFTK